MGFNNSWNIHFSYNSKFVLRGLFFINFNLLTHCSVDYFKRGVQELISYVPNQFCVRVLIIIINSSTVCFLATGRLWYYWFTFAVKGGDNICSSLSIYSSLSCQICHLSCVIFVLVRMSLLSSHIFPWSFSGSETLPNFIVCTCGKLIMFHSQKMSNPLCLLFLHVALHDVMHLLFLMSSFLTLSW